jgi:hypothetical protein
MLFILPFAQAQAETKNPLTYENKELGVKITGPEGWHITKTIQLARYQVTEPVCLVTFSISLPSVSSECFISLNVKPLQLSEFKTPMDIANAAIQGLRFKEFTFKVIKNPTTVTQHNQEGVNYMYSFKTSYDMKSSNYIFIKDNIEYGLYFQDRAESFDENLKIFEATANSLVLK